MVAATHCFEKSLMMTVIQDNINPLEKLERFLLRYGSCVCAQYFATKKLGKHADAQQKSTSSLLTKQ